MDENTYTVEFILCDEDGGWNTERVKLPIHLRIKSSQEIVDYAQENIFDGYNGIVYIGVFNSDVDECDECLDEGDEDDE